MGTIQESKDRSSNLKLSGAVKNIGGRRADFVKVNFIFRQDWSGNTKTLTSFVKGSFHTFESGITSDKRVAFYCGTGWRASEAFFYAYLMGWEKVAVYDGGWLEWSRGEANPIESGEP